MVLESTIEEEEFQNDISSPTNEQADQIQSDNNIVSIEKKNSELIDKDNDDGKNNIEEAEITFVDQETIFDLDKEIFNKYIHSIVDIKSNILMKEFVSILSNFTVDKEIFSEDKFYSIVKKLYDIGELKSAYKIVKSLNPDIAAKINNKEYFYLIELNYLYSSFKLNEVCDLKTELIINSINLPKYLLEKTDIFCLLLENKITEAKLLNAVLVESEKEEDNNFQKLFNYMTAQTESDPSNVNISNIKSKELIFLYSAMLRINELPLDKNFIKIDSLNLSIPVILSESTDMSTRIQAANNAYFDNVISIDSLSALYQSVDFSSKELANPSETISSLNSDELKMAYYFQLANTQIFPDDRLKVIISYWDFSKKIGLEKIAYSLTEKIIETFIPSAENAEFSMHFAKAHIANRNFEESLNWIKLYEVSNENIENSEYAKFLIHLNKNDELKTIIDYLRENYKNFQNLNNQKTLETIDVLVDFLEIENLQKTTFSSFEITDSRLMPSYYLIKQMYNKIEEQKDLTVFMLAIISMDNKKWTELYPDHLKLLLNAFELYDDGILIKPVILEILNELKIFDE